MVKTVWGKNRIKDRGRMRVMAGRGWGENRLSGRAKKKSGEGKGRVRAGKKVQES